MSPFNALAARSLDDGSILGDRVHFVHVYTVEAHPQAPDPSPYSGAVWELEFSEVRQAYTYADREAAARRVRPRVEGPQLFLIDALAPGEMVNPVWCSYGPVPNGAYLIRQDGIIEVAQEWADLDALETATLSLLSKDRKAP